MAGLGKILSRVFFWTYERGSWQYDVAVVLIVMFVLLTPRHFFHDQPQVGSSASGHVTLVSASDDGHIQTYRVDAGLVAVPKEAAELQNDLHNAMQHAVAGLSSGRFSISRVDPEVNAHGATVDYRVEIRTDLAVPQRQ